MKTYVQCRVVNIQRSLDLCARTSYRSSLFALSFHAAHAGGQVSWKTNRDENILFRPFLPTPLTPGDKFFGKRIVMSSHRSKTTRAGAASTFSSFSLRWADKSTNFPGSIEVWVRSGQQRQPCNSCWWHSRMWMGRQARPSAPRFA